jgi:hypothetical protein
VSTKKIVDRGHEEALRTIGRRRSSHWPAIELAGNREGIPQDPLTTRDTRADLVPPAR